MRSAGDERKSAKGSRLLLFGCGTGAVRLEQLELFLITLNF